LLCVKVYTQYKGRKGGDTILEWKIEDFKKGCRYTKKKTLVIEDFPFEWMWEKSLRIKELLRGDKEIILKKAEEYIKAREEADSRKLVNLSWKSIEEATKAQWNEVTNKEIEIDKLREVFNECYPNGPIDIKRFKSKLNVRVNKENDRLVVVFRENNEPLFDIGSKLGFRTKIRKIYFIRLNSGWEFVTEM
jgi:hypothetical protein